MSANVKYLSAIIVILIIKPQNWFRFFALGIFLCIAAGSISARAQSNSPRIGVDQAEITRIEDYLNSISTLRSRFLQENADGSISEGNLYLHRPGKLRLEYDPPDPYLLLVKDEWLIFLDKELEQTTYIPIEKTPAFFLTKQNVKLSGDLDITSFERRNGAVRIGLAWRGDTESGDITLIFSASPLTLRKWRAYDVQGGESNTTLINPEFGVALKGALFDFEEPLPEASN
jgi:outer membrane lipoprotein-sorting protein